MLNKIQVSMIFALLAFCASAHTAVVSFQEGVAGYTGNDATYIYATNFSTSHDHLDFVNTGGSGNATLIRFNDIFGAGADKIDNGATINNATLTLTTLPGGADLSAEVNDVYRIKEDWSAGTDWITFAGGTSLTALQSKLSDAATPYASFVPGSAATEFVIDITALVQEWANGTYDNHGLAINNLNPGGDGASFYSDNVLQAGLRPLLTVDFNEVSVPGPAPAAVFLLALVALTAVKQRS